MPLRIRVRNIVLTLGLLTLVLVMLPRQATSFLAAPIQLLSPFQSVASRIIEGGRRLFAGRNPGESSPADSERLIVALQNQVASQQARLESLEIQNAALAQYRRELTGAERLISARVISRDPVAWRSSLLLAAGTQRGVESGSGVVTRFFVDTGADSGVRGGMSVLAGEVLVGFVDQVEGGVAKVRLLGDIESRMAVRLGRISEDETQLLNARFWLTGSPSGELFIRGVDHRYVNSGEIKVGDQVMTLDDDARLPVTVVIGSVKTMEVQLDNRLLYDLTVEPALAAESIGHVYVVDVGGHAGAS